MITIKKFQLVAEIKSTPKNKLVSQNSVCQIWTSDADVMSIWKKYGFVPPSEVRDDYYFKINRDGGQV